MHHQRGSPCDERERQQRQGASAPGTADGSEFGARAMKHRRVSSFIDDVLANRRPRRFRASDADAEVLRTAITMQAARPGDVAPQPQFVDNLRKELALQVAAASPPPVRPVVSRRSRVLVGVAAAVTVIGGTAAATTGIEHGLAAAPAPKVAYSQLLRMGTYQSKDGKTVGEIVAYRGNPWGEL